MYNYGYYLNARMGDVAGKKYHSSLYQNKDAAVEGRAGSAKVN